MTRRNATATGVVDGVNDTFAAPTSYRPGAITVQVNGQTVPPGDVTELGINVFQLATPPKPGGVVTVRYTPVV